MARVAAGGLDRLDPTLTIAALLVLFTLLAPTPSTVASPDPGYRMQPNTASAAELQLLPRVGPKLAANLIDARQRAPFTKLIDLDAVPRIGPATLAAMQPWLTFADATPLAHKEVLR